MAQSVVGGLNVYTSSLTALQTANIMMLPQRTDFTLIDITRLAYSVTIVIKNLNTNEETVLAKGHPIADDFETTWINPYIDHPVFRNIDFGASFKRSYLSKPKGTELCTTCIFSNGAGETLQAMAFLVHTPHLANTDTVVVHVATPQVDVTLDQYKKLSTFKERRNCALHYAFKAFSLAIQHGQNFQGQPRKVNPAAAVIYYDDTMPVLGADNYNFNFAFSLPATEKTAGTHTIPAALKTLRFLVPGLGSTKAVYYDILQIHKSAYVFRLRNLAGWKVIGAVNTTIASFDLVNSFFEKFVPGLERTIAISEDILTIFPGNQHTLKNEARALKITQHNSLLNRPDISGKAISENFFNENKLLFTQANVTTLLPDTWSNFITWIGLTIIFNYYDYSSGTLSTDALLRRIIQALQVQDPKNIKPFSQHEAVQVAKTYFEFCSGLATKTISDGTILTSEELSPYLLKEQLADDVCISKDDAVGILTICLGEEPSSWCAKILKNHSKLFTSSQQLATFILLTSPDDESEFKQLFPQELFMNIRSTVMDAKNYDKSIHEASVFGSNLLTNTPSQMPKGLAYTLFTRNFSLLHKAREIIHAEKLVDTLAKINDYETELADELATFAALALVQKDADAAMAAHLNGLAAAAPLDSDAKAESDEMIITAAASVAACDAANLVVTDNAAAKAARLAARLAAAQAASDLTKP